MSRIRDLIDRLEGKAPPGAERSPRWRKTRDAFLKGKVCVVCGGKIRLVAHHLVPFHLAPDMELDEQNLLPLCESGRFGANCHLLFGHLGNWSRTNLIVEADVAYWGVRLRGD